jgi:hypothetical protein
MGGQVGSWVAKSGGWVVIVGRWVAKLVARLLATAALWVRIQTSLQDTKWATKAKEWPKHFYSPYKKITFLSHIEWELACTYNRYKYHNPFISIVLYLPKSHFCHQDQDQDNIRFILHKGHTVCDSCSEAKYDRTF